MSFMALKDYKKAIQSFLIAKKSDPYNKNLTLNIVDCYTSARKFSEARKLLDEHLAQSPNDAEMIYAYGMTYYKENKKSKADKYFNQAFKLKPSLKSLRFKKMSF